MSSSYSLVCMNHDPAIEFAEDLSAGDVEQYSLADTLAAKADQHRNCEIVITRISGAPFQVACLAKDHGHRTPQWVDVDLLRIAHQARRVTGNPDLTRALERHHQLTKCWPELRLERLDPIVHLVPWKGEAAPAEMPTPEGCRTYIAAGRCHHAPSGQRHPLIWER